MRRHEVTDEQWELVAELMPRGSPRGGGRWRDHRQVLNGLLWRLCTGAQWRDLPDRYGLWQTAHARLSRWRRDGTLDRILDRLRLRLDAEGMIDLDTWCMDGTSIRAGRSAAGAQKSRRGRARGPRARPLPRRVHDQAPPADRRRQRPAVGGPPHARTAAREPGVRAADERRPTAAPPGPATHEAAAAARRPHAQHARHPGALPAAADHGRASAAVGRETPTQARPAARLRPGRPPQARRRRAVRRLAQGMPRRRHPLREAGRGLPRDRQTRLRPPSPAAPAAVRQDLARPACWAHARCPSAAGDTVKNVGGSDRPIG